MKDQQSRDQLAMKTKPLTDAFSRNDYPKVIEILEDLAKTDPHSRSQYLNLYLKAQIMLDPKKGIQLARQALVDPQMEPQHLGLAARSMLSVEDLEKDGVLIARKMAEKAVEATGEDASPNAYRALARACYLLEDYPSAVSYAEKTLDVAAKARVSPKFLEQVRQELAQYRQALQKT